VLRSEGLQAEARTHKPLRNDEVIRDERLSHSTRVRQTCASGARLASASGEQAGAQLLVAALRASR
jgi:hypothetical protein